MCGEAKEGMSQKARAACAAEPYHPGFDSPDGAALGRMPAGAALLQQRDLGHRGQGRTAVHVGLESGNGAGRRRVPTAARARHAANSLNPTIQRRDRNCSTARNQSSFGDPAGHPLLCQSSYASEATFSSLTS